MELKKHFVVVSNVAYGSRLEEDLSTFPGALIWGCINT